MTPATPTPAAVIPKRFCRDCQRERDAASFVRIPFAKGRGSMEICGICKTRRSKPARLS